MFNLELLNKGSRAFIIDPQGRDHPVDMLSINKFLAEEKVTVKVEGMESVFTEYAPATVHVYVSPKNAASFANHTDPYDVDIHCVQGIKTMKVDGKEYWINEGQTLRIPANVPHEATNEYNSIMLSIGYEC